MSVTNNLSWRSDTKHSHRPGLTCKLPATGSRRNIYSNSKERFLHLSNLIIKNWNLNYTFLIIHFDWFFLNDQSWHIRHKLTKKKTSSSPQIIQEAVTYQYFLIILHIKITKPVLTNKEKKKKKIHRAPPLTCLNSPGLGWSQGTAHF